MMSIPLAVSPAFGQASVKSEGGAGRDYSQEAAVIEQSSLKVQFENDGTSREEQTARIHVQSDAGVQRYGLLTFSYASGTGKFSVDYVRVHKTDGSVVETGADAIQDMAAEITRQAPFYSDLREKHVAVKGLGIGDVLEYKTSAAVTKPLAAGHFWVDYTFTHDAVLLQEMLEVSVPRDRAIKYKSPQISPTVSEAGKYRTYKWTNASLDPKPEDDKLEAAKLAWEQARGRYPQADVQLTSFASWDELGKWFAELRGDREKPTPEITAKAKELTQGMTDAEAQQRAIYHYVSTQFRYIGIAFGAGRCQQNPPPSVMTPAACACPCSLRTDSPAPRLPNG